MKITHKKRIAIESNLENSLFPSLNNREMCVRALKLFIRNFIDEVAQEKWVEKLLFRMKRIPRAGKNRH